MVVGEVPIVRNGSVFQYLHKLYKATVTRVERHKVAATFSTASGSSNYILYDSIIPEH